MSLPKAKLNSKLHFQIRPCFGSSSSHLKRRNISHVWLFSLCLQAVIVKMQITVKYRTDIISVLTLHPFCCKCLVSFPISLLFFLLPFSVGEGFYPLPFCWILSHSTKPLLAFLQPSCLLLDPVSFTHSSLPEPNIYLPVVCCLYLY